ncbi:hypothetical protein, partial [Tenacibaculum discolor]|uniref:hypothetical protein n=1 Tax=Tenacibaculum discolor TaxID=361581 RepID=UPI001F457607
KTTATLQANFSTSGGGPNYTQWLNNVQTSGLPNASSTVTISPINEVLVTISWQAPGDSTRKYAVKAQLSQ